MDRLTVPLLVGVALLAPCPVRAETYHVSAQDPNAGDGNPGTAALPFRTLRRAAQYLRPGDTVVLGGGVYRESVSLRVSGVADRPITFRAAPGQRVVLSGADPIAGWKPCSQRDVDGSPHHANLFQVELDWLPERLLEGARAMTVARVPPAGWWALTGAEGGAVQDSLHLTQTDPNAWAGWTLVALHQARGAITRHTDFRFDPAGHSFRLARRWSASGPADSARDRYYMENHLSALEGPGQYVYVRLGGRRYRLYVWPTRLSGGLPDIQAPRRGTLLEVTGCQHLVFESLEIAYSTHHGIGMARPGDTGHLLVQNCYIHDNRSGGISLRRPHNVILRRNVIRRNGVGVILAGSRDTLVEENEIASNHGDGLVAPSGTRNLRIRRNCIRDHYRWARPDNIQVWSDVQGVRIEDNVLLNAGQNLASAEMSDAVVTGNILCGSRGASLALGGGRIQVLGNTIVASGLPPTGLNGKAFTVRQNIIAPLNTVPCYVVPDANSWSSDHNLLWQGGGQTNLVRIGRRNATLEELRRLGHDANSRLADPKFLNAPKQFTVTDATRIPQCTADKLYLSGGGFAPGDVVEIAFDGVPRKVTQAGGGLIVFAPPLGEPPVASVAVANWGDRPDIAWDLRVADGSPARKAGPDGHDLGASIDLRAFLRGDFDGDGRRDLPFLPEED